MSDVRIEDQGSTTVLSARVDREQDHFSRRVEYRFHGCSSDVLSERGDAFLAGLLLPAMRVAEDLRIEAPVSPRLIGRIDEITELLVAFRPTLSRVKVIAPTAPPEHQGEGVGLFFSGGVDSFYSLIKNMEESPDGPNAITHLLFGFGIDTRYGYDQDYMDRVAPMMHEVAAEAGKQAIIFESNLRADFSFVGWMLYHGPALISTSLALSPLLGRCLIASGRPGDDLRAWGSHPQLDPLWSTESLEVVHDGLEAYRTQKIASRIARSDLALRTLRVCFKAEQQPQNCGRCPECLRTMVALHAAGVLDRCATFPKSLNLRRIATMYIGDRKWAVQKLLEVVGEQSPYDRRLRKAIKLALWRHDRKQNLKRLLPNR